MQLFDEIFGNAWKVGDVFKAFDGTKVVNLEAGMERAGLLAELAVEHVRSLFRLVSRFFAKTLATLISADGFKARAKKFMRSMPDMPRFGGGGGGGGGGDSDSSGSSASSASSGGNEGGNRLFGRMIAPFLSAEFTLHVEADPGMWSGCFR